MATVLAAVGVELVALGTTEAAAVKMYWTNDYGLIQSANPDGGSVRTVYDAGIEIAVRGIALDETGCKLYFTEIPAPGIPGRIRRINLDGTAAEDLVTGLVQPQDLALDLSNGRLYWSEYLGGTPLPPGGQIASKIMQANLAGPPAPQDVPGLGLAAGLQVVHGLAIDVGGGMVYWTDERVTDQTPRVQRANLDGTGSIQDLITTGLLVPDDLALEPPGKLHFTDTGTGKIWSANLDGTAAQDIRTGLGTPQGLAIDLADNKMYWTTNGGISRANLMGAETPEDLVSTPLPRKIVLKFDADSCPVCGDDDISGPEACDDGNATAGDGCSGTCSIEPGWQCTGEPSVCAPICGDGLIRGAEGCDDGNITAGDCCSATCAVEPDCNCSGAPSVCHLCGDGVVSGSEECDLGPATTTSGNCPAGACDTSDSCDPDCSECARTCTSACKLRGRCTGSGGCCTSASDCPVGQGCCGNGTTEAPEQCDDGNLAGGDTCTPACALGVDPPNQCCPRGSEISAATVLVRKKVKLTKLGGTVGDDQLKTGGEAILGPGQDLHPCTEGVTYCLESPTAILYGQDDDDGVPGPDSISGADPAVTGAQMAQPCVDQVTPRKVRVNYKDRAKPPVGSDPDGVKGISLKNVASQPNKYKFKVLLRDVDLSAAVGATTLRQTLVIGDTCVVLKLTCTAAGTTTAVCVPAP